MKIITLIFFIIIVALLLNHTLFRLLYQHYKSLPLPHSKERGLIVVLGAGVVANQPSRILEDRLKAARRLFSEYQHSNIFLTGAPQEIPIMQQWLLQKNIPTEKIILDAKGLRTAASCFNMQIYKKDYEHFWLVTQAYHLPRALLLCHAAGIEARPYPSDEQVYQGMMYYQAREYLSQFIALWDMVKLYWIPTAR